MKFRKILGYEPTENQGKLSFILWRCIQTFIYIGYMIFFFINRDKIVYRDDLWGKTADYYKSMISFTSAFVIVVEPMFNYHNYKAFQERLKSFHKLLNEKIENLADVKKIQNEIMRKLRNIIVSFMVIYILCEINNFYRSMKIEQTRNIYFCFFIITILLYSKVWFIVHRLLIINECLVILIKAMQFINQELANNDKLDSKVYNKMIHDKYLAVINLYKLVQKMVGIFNDLGFPQLVILLAIKLYLMGDFYWISLVTMHNRIRMAVTYTLLVASFPKILILLIQAYLSERINVHNSKIINLIHKQQIVNNKQQPLTEHFIYTILMDKLEIYPVGVVKFDYSTLRDVAIDIMQALFIFIQLIPIYFNLS
ncbi:unnamed protein product [Chironomus riparius]|uniref:Gustatory receptor n=1 Tax=Chironomus riparius TaxID=315576 RepID=A0A9N9WQ72_9DIPT|nr:unnamed protein product [Chironomus riparius]